MDYFRKEHFYIVYDNGDYEETEEFQCSGTEVYKLYMVDDIETDLEGMLLTQKYN